MEGSGDELRRRIRRMRMVKNRVPPMRVMKKRVLFFFEGSKSKEGTGFLGWSGELLLSDFSALFKASLIRLIYIVLISLMARRTSW